MKKYQGNLKTLFSQIPEEEMRDIYTRALAVARNVKRGMEEKFPDAKYYRQEVNPEVINIGDYNQAGQRIYAANVTLMRAVPNILDGLKPVERRSLYAMAILAKAVKKAKKGLSIIGAIITIHPHGDISLQDTLTGMAKPWESLYPLVHTDSNKGVANGMKAAAARYLDLRISDYCYDCFFKEWDPDIVEMSRSYNPELMEPDYISPRYPNMLVRCVNGFCFGALTSIPSFNLEEAFNETCKLIRNPDYEPFMYPDLPAGCSIIDDGKFPEIYRTGKGTFTMKAECEIDRENNTIHIYSLPYHTSVPTVISSIKELIKKGELAGIKELYDHTNKYGIHIKMVCLPDMNIDEIVRILYKKARLIDTFTVQMLYVDDYELRMMSLKDVMQSWIDNRRIMKDKFITHDLVRLRERQHILDALIDITSDIEKSKQMIEDVNKSNDDTMIPKLMKRFKKLTSLQAAQLLDMKVKSFNTSRHQKYVDEFNENKKTIKHYEKMVLKPELIDNEIIEELQDAIRKYAQPRKCKIEKPSTMSDSKTMNIEYNIVFTKKGLVKKINGDSQEIGKLNDGDEPLRVCRVKNSDSIVCFDRSGLIHTIKVSDISQTQLKDTGVQIGKYATIRSDVVMTMPMSEIKDKGQFVFVTERGMIKRTRCSKYAFKSSVIAINLKENDGLARVVYCDKDNSDIIVFTRQGVGNRFSLSEFQETNRASFGVIGIDVAKDDAVMGAVLVGKKDTSIAILTNRGNGKMCDLDTFTTGKRRGVALRVIKVSDKEKLLDVIPCNSKDKFLVVMKKDIIELKFEDFPKLTRNHHGKKMIGVPLGDSIIRFLKK